MANAGHRFELILSVANLDAAAWLWTVLAREAPAIVERDGRREVVGTAGSLRLRLHEPAGGGPASPVPVELGVDVGAIPDVLQAAAEAGYPSRLVDDGSGDRIVTLPPGVDVVLRAQSPPPLAVSTTSPAGRLVRRPPRAEAPRAKRPDRKKADAGRAVPESSARAPRRIVRPRGQVRKVGKK